MRGQAPRATAAELESDTNARASSIAAARARGERARVAAAASGGGRSGGGGGDADFAAAVRLRVPLFGAPPGTRLAVAVPGAAAGKDGRAPRVTLVVPDHAAPGSVLEALVAYRPDAVSAGEVRAGFVGWQRICGWFAFGNAAKGRGGSTEQLPFSSSSSSLCFALFFAGWQRLGIRRRCWRAWRRCGGWLRPRLPPRPRSTPTSPLRASTRTRPRVRMRRRKSTCTGGSRRRMRRTTRHAHGSLTPRGGA
jgi:hypothetical protein